MSQRHSIPTSGAAVPAALRVKKCHHLSPCRSCQLNAKCCICLDKLACGSARIRGGAPSPRSPSDESNDNFDDAGDDSDSSSENGGDDHTFRAPIPSLGDTPREEAASRNDMEALEEDGFWQRCPDTIRTNLSTSPVPSHPAASPSRELSQVVTSQPHTELPLAIPSGSGTQVPTSQPSIEASLQAPPRTPATPRTALLPYLPVRSRHDPTPPLILCKK